MATSSIHIQRATAGSAGHNSREHYSYSVVFSDEKNECTNTVAESYKTYRSELAIRSKEYTERTGQKLQKKAVTQLSAIVNLEQHHTLKDLEPIKAELERLFDTKVYQMAIHRDEGKLVSKEDGTELYSGKDFFLNPEKNKLFFDKKFSKPVPMENYEVVKNYHAHIEMMGLDSKGNAIRQKMNRVALQGLQTTVAKTLQMERGKPREGYTKEEMKQIVAVVGKKSDYESPTLYAQKFNEVAKELRIFKESDKRKDTHKYKDDGAEREKAKRQALATQKELKAEIARLKDQLQLAGAGRAEYAALEQINRELKEQIRAKDLTISDMQAKLKEAQKPQHEPINASLVKLKDEIASIAKENNIPTAMSTEAQIKIIGTRLGSLKEEVKAERSEKNDYAEKLAEIHHAYEHEPSTLQPILDRQQVEIAKEPKEAYKTALQRRDDAYRQRMGREPTKSYSRTLK